MDSIVEYHWIMTVQTHDGRLGTNDGIIQEILGHDNHQSMYESVLNGMKEWTGSEKLVVLFYSCTPDKL